MDILLASLFELALFFIIFIFSLQMFKSLRYEHLFKKGHTKEIQFVYIGSVLIFSYLLTRAIMNLITLTFNLT